MNTIIYKISEYIIEEKIRKINLDNIVELFIDDITKYISEDEVYSFEFNTRIFKKLVLYDYCYHYFIDGLSNKEINIINNYLHNDKYELELHIEDNMLRFLDWCKKYNQKIKSILAKEISYTINKKDKYHYNAKQIYIVSHDNKNITFK
jgi:hypothetical protein